MNPRKHEKTLAALKRLESDHNLNPLRQAVLKTELLKRIAKTETATTEVGGFAWIPLFKPMPIIATLIISIFVAGSAALATQNSLPGDALHPVKLAAENLEIRLAASEQTRAQLEARHADERLVELSHLRIRATNETAVEARIKIENQHRSAETMTQTELENALNVLQTVQTKLEDRGNLTAAAAIKNVLTRLADRATNSNFEVELEREHGDIKVKLHTEDRTTNRSNDDNDDDGDDDRSDNQVRSITTTVSPLTPTRARIEFKNNGEIEIETEQADSNDDD